MTEVDLFSLDGKTALVTGGARGVGRICAEALLERGASVLITTRNEEAAAAAEQELSLLGPCSAIVANLATTAGVHEVKRQVETRLDRLDILVNNAGVTWGAPLEDYPPEGWAKVLNLDLAVPFQLVQALVELLVAAGRDGAPARIVNLGSVDGHAAGSYDNFAYAAAKAGLHQLTRLLAQRLGPQGVTVNCIAPGPIRTKMTEQLLAGSGAGMIATNPLGRIAEAEDVAGALVYLTARSGAYVNGVVLPVDGGFSIATWGDVP